MAGCRCVIGDWAGLRLALGMTQVEFAALLRVSVRTIKRHEAGRHVCAAGAMEGMALAWLQEPAKQAALERAGVPLPWGVRRAAG